MMEDIELGNIEQEEIEAPDEPGPSLLGRTPVVGTARRNYGVLVLRDEIND